MNVVGKVGSLISQGVYSVATPFHPFGGAVDVIVVEQQDGTYRSTPWYVRFGKFQGVLKGAEKVVSISVNNVEVPFHMYLDNSGQAYFMRELSTGPTEPGQTSATGPTEPVESDLNDEDSYRFDPAPSSPSSSSNYQYSSLEEVEEMVKESNGSNSEMVLVSVDGHVLTAPISSTEENTEKLELNNLELNNPQFHLGPGESTSGDFSGNSDVWENGIFGHLEQTEGENEKDFQEVSVETSMDATGPFLNKEDTFKSCLDLTRQIEEGYSEDVPSPVSVEERKISINLERGNENVSLDCVHEEVEINDSGDISKQIEETSASADLDKTADLSSGERSLERKAEAEECGGGPEVKSGNDDMAKSETEVPERSRADDELNQTDTAGFQRHSFVGLEISLCGNLLRAGMGRESAEEAFKSHIISEEEFRSSGPSILKNANLIVKIEGKYFPYSKAAHLVLGKAVFGPDFKIELKEEEEDAIIPVELEEGGRSEDKIGISPSFSRRWRLWPIPFRLSRSLQRTDSSSSADELFLDTESALPSPTSDQATEFNNNNNNNNNKQYVRTNMPTNEQIASMNLKEGQNIVAFSFCTRVLGEQQVDAHIYLWKWNTRIVISDVDGTITKSDVLGQFMPLVGKDWTQSGVARLFSAIKENGYQLLFLSARAIVQAYLTRSFLLNLKQDGKALPNGPVVISPDGLFPSLYREVIRRAPHEFKIACLEDIKALFPSDYNPFYAGFGNRDTDELSYRKIGIPKGKIFIINPKGEVAINSSVDVKSYTSLHTLVNDMFPPTSMVEQEDYNSWNYWKMPLPSIHC